MLDDAEVVRWFVQLGVGGVLAGVLLFFYRKDVRSYTELWREASERNERQTMQMIAIAERSAGAISENTEVMRSLHKRVDRLDMLRVVPDDEANPRR